MDTPVTANQGPEQRPAAPAVETAPVVTSVEQAPQPAAVEQAPQPAVVEQAPRPSDVSAQNAGQPADGATTASLTRDDVAKAIAAMPTPVAPTSPMPSAAADQDIIEPEWVDAAERVIAETAGNPHAEEEGFEELQVDYLKKRYGHEVKPAEDA